MIFQLKYKLRNLIVLTLIALLFCPPALVQAASLEGTVKKSFILSDHLGSTISVINESGIEESHTEYKSFGSIKQESGSTTLKKKFTGKELDESTGLYDYEARQYDADIGRFITADTADPKLEDPQTLNRYSYTLNNPLKYIDPTGHAAESPYDVASTMLSAAEFAQNPNLTNAAFLAADLIATAIPGLPAPGLAVRAMRAARKADDVGKQAGRTSIDLGKKTFSRFMSKSEAKLVEKTGFLRGGKKGTTHFTDNKFRTKESAYEKLSLDSENRYDVRLDFKTTNKPGIKGPNTVKPRYGQPGGGKEYSSGNQIQVKIIRQIPLRRRR